MRYKWRFNLLFFFIMGLRTRIELLEKRVKDIGTNLLELDNNTMKHDEIKDECWAED